MTEVGDGWSVSALGDRAVLVEFADVSDREAFDATRHRRLLALDRAIARRSIDGVVEVQPALVNLLVRFDPLVTDHATVATAVATTVPEDDDEPPEPVTRRVEVCHDPTVAPDLVAVAHRVGLTVEEVVAAHLGAVYEVLMYGFAPGYAYLGGLPERLALPRKPAAVRDVPRGSIIIAGRQCLVTTVDMPTGWWVIGRSPTPMVSDDDVAPFPVAVGDLVEFAPVGLDAVASTEGG